jgi:hypothetical protein
MPEKVPKSTSQNTGPRSVTVRLPALTQQQSERLSALGIVPSSVPRELVLDAFSAAEEQEMRGMGFKTIPESPLPPQVESASGSAELQPKLDAWCAAGGYENDGFRAFFGL